VDALEVARLQRVVLDWHSQPAHCRIKGWPLGNGPRAQDLADLDPEVEMQPRCVMKLHDKTGGRHPVTVPPVIRGRASARRGCVFRAAVRREGDHAMLHTQTLGTKTVITKNCQFPGMAYYATLSRLGRDREAKAVLVEPDRLRPSSEGD